MTQMTLESLKALVRSLILEPDCALTKTTLADWFEEQNDQDVVDALRDTSKFYAEAKWAVGDIESLRPDWTDEQCEEFLEEHAKYIQESMISDGWNVIQNFLDDYPEMEEEEDPEEEDEDGELVSEFDVGGSD